MSEGTEGSRPACLLSWFPSALSGVEFENFHYATWSLFCRREKKTRSIVEIIVYIQSTLFQSDKLQE